MSTHEFERRVTGGHERTHQQGAQRALALLSLLVFQNVLESVGWGWHALGSTNEKEMVATAEGP